MLKHVQVLAAVYGDLPFGVRDVAEYSLRDKVHVRTVTRVREHPLHPRATRRRHAARARRRIDQPVPFRLNPYRTGRGCSSPR